MQPSPKNTQPNGNPSKPWLPKEMRLPLLIALAWNGLVYWGAGVIAGGWPHHLVELPADQLIPFLPWTASIYFGCYAFWAFNYCLSVRGSREAAYRFLSADFLAKAVCFVIFLVFPTTNVRPEVGESGFWNGVMSLLYRVDAPTNLFPSIHCLVSWLCFRGVQNQKQIPRWYSVCSFWFALAVFVSTLTTKQHVLIDVLGGVVLAELAFQLTGRLGFSDFYRNWINKRYKSGR